MRRNQKLIEEENADCLKPLLSFHDSLQTFKQYMDTCINNSSINNQTNHDRFNFLFSFPQGKQHFAKTINQLSDHRETLETLRRLNQTFKPVNELLRTDFEKAVTQRKSNTAANLASLDSSFHSNYLKKLTDNITAQNNAANLHWMLQQGFDASEYINQHLNQFLKTNDFKKIACFLVFCKKKMQPI